MKENILSIAIGAVITLVMSIARSEAIETLFFSFIGGFIGFMGNSACKYLLQKLKQFINEQKNSNQKNPENLAK